MAAGLSVRIMLLALLGGLILNLMPCVLPVLALKLSSVLSAVGAPRRQLRLRFLAGAAGIVSSFMLLAGGLAILRLAGGTVGWGIQFQNPVFLAVMIAMLGLFAVSLLDRLVIPVPRFAQALAGMAGDPQSAGVISWGFPCRHAGDNSGDTLFGAVCRHRGGGGAVGRDGGSLWHLSGAGLGLAAPWLLVAARPSLVAFLPRPGPWMDWMKRGLALLLVGTMVWLGSVLAEVIVTNRAGQRQQRHALASLVAAGDDSVACGRHPGICRCDS